MLANNAEYKYEMPYKYPFVITQCCTNITVTLQCGLIQISHNLCRVGPYTYDTNVEHITTGKYV